MKSNAPVPVTLAVATSIAVIVSSAAGATAATTSVESEAAAGTSAHTVLSGRIARHGKGVPGEVAVRAWPSSAVLATQEEGTAFVNPVVYRGKASRTGEFSVIVDAASLPASVIGDEGQVDLQVSVTDGTVQGEWATSVFQQSTSPDFKTASRAHGSSPRRWTARAGGTGPERVTLDLAMRTADTSASPRATWATSNHHAERDTRLRETDAGAGPSLAVFPRNAASWAPNVQVTPKRTAAGSGTASLVADECTSVARAIVYNLPQQFMNVYTWSGALGTVDFNAGSDHTLGIGVAASGRWSTSGTKTISTASGATATGLADASVRNKVNYRDYYDTCTYRTYRRPYSFYSLIPSGNATYAAHVNYAYCGGANDYYIKGQSTWKRAGNNLTFSGGVDIGPLNVSSNARYSTETSLKFVIEANTYVCGSTSQGWATAPNMSAKRR
jgi:hypothetical protein